MIYAFIVDTCADLPVTVACRTMKVSRSAFHAWRRQQANPTQRMLADVELARLGDKPKSQVAAELGISDSCLRNWLRQADIDDGARPGLSSDERDELVALRRKNRVLELEVEILKRALAYFARENVLPK